MSNTERKEIWFIIQDDKNSSDAQRAVNLASQWRRLNPVFIFHQPDGPRLKQIWRMIGNKQPAAIYCFNYDYFILFLALWCRLFWPGVKFIFDTGDLAYRLSVLFYPSRVKALLMGCYEWGILRLADTVVVRGRWHIEYLRRRGITSAFVVPDGVNLGTVREVDASSLKDHLFGSGAFVVGLLGFMGWSKTMNRVWYGWDLLEAARILKHTPIKFAMVGFGPGEEEFRRKIREYGLESNTVLLGRMPREKTSEWLSMFDIVLNTQPNEDAFWVRTTGKLPLYLATDRYILTSDVGEAHYVLPREMLIDYRGLVDDTYPQRMAQKIEYLFNNRSALDLRKNGRHLAEEHFDYAKLSLSLERRLEDLTTARLEQ
jgi:glycosyltransferase involved in cell wall biosynthesis